MAGVKGRSGGARPGAGRKPKAVQAESAAPTRPAKRASAEASNPDEPQPLPATDEPLTFLLAVQNSEAIDIRTRVRAAIAAAQYKHTKRGDGGKKEEAAGKAKKAAGGRFAPKAPPKLVVSNR